MRAALPPRMIRKVIAALQAAVLVVVSAELLPLVLAQLGAALALGFLTWSFGTDIRWLWTRRRFA
jgi:hypothetical protein